MPSLQRFPLGPQQVNLAYQAGFAHAVHYPIAGGMMGVLVATKSVDS
jgi:demethylmenaquinone methyltransferase/2-methoxy-6-polyprenyl-1,4-benzoquinol methylase